MLRFMLALALALPVVAQADPGRHSAREDDRPHAARANNHHSQRRVVLDQRRLGQRLDAIDAEMDALEALLASAPEPSTWRGHRRARPGDHRRARHESVRHHKAVAAQLAAVRARIKSLHRAVDHARPARRIKPRPVAPVAMSKRQLQRLTRSLDDARFRADKRAVLRRAVKHNHFTSAQARVVARQFTFSDDKVAALTAMHPRVVDPENFEQAFSDLTFSSARRKLDANIYASNDRSRR